MKRHPQTLYGFVRKSDLKNRPKIASIFRGIVAGVKHLHSLELAHNDIKPANIMIDHDDHPVIIDLGACKPLNRSQGDWGIAQGPGGGLEGDHRRYWYVMVVEDESSAGSTDSIMEDNQY
ncbi:hypothetical protein GGS26DRAFT_596152 [Hypomontagnella submonticulosa]|nr:hypothetical protein GGS26DRAFT_596152 [Hypomontagnella submonticulosa]